MLALLSLVLFGFIVGVIARLLMPGYDGSGVGATIPLGIVGAVLGGWIGRALGFDGPDNGAAFFIALLGSVILLAIYSFIFRRTDVTEPHGSAGTDSQ